ncbi:hypothetical protein K450DRAFT_186562 [Umbelopsis ramanniana AG]|uniref:UDP-N-acetylglucosamine diphosphorylase n=1 Tax=Umbelopsis ramanniana AG TaxID=1314678 RepID=A0AAD5ED71_UMBRA|nr:uncharacterized protein K450DRAFT_186562 [Umbelopsis ramanniana AG]KAI8580820.1 hypothetical protein K450DRAFT_186562 [Umbelopsis ramanniana AG]
MTQTIFTESDVTTLRSNFDAAGQGHVFNFWDTLTSEQQQVFYNQLVDLDVTRVNQIYDTAVKGAAACASAQAASVEPLPTDVTDSVLTADASKVEEWTTLGLKLIAEGKVAVILMAGGQGTRLGSSAPKGCYDINLPSGKTLFQLQAERILKVQELARARFQVKDQVVVPWYIMTSGPTHAPTFSFFEQNNYFGLDKSNVIFFEQGTLPCLTMDGKILLEEKGKVAIAPDGNGGIYRALHSKGVIASLKERGILYSHCYCVDNCLARVADPVFIGYSASKKSDCGVKVVGKSKPEEPVGVVCLKDKKYGVLEYSEISKELSEMRRPDGTLAFNAANIVNHLFSTAFLERVPDFAHELEYHIAKKKIKHTDLESGEQIAPKAINGMKMECFVFDVFPYAHNLSVLEVARKEEFSPLKNAPGSGVDCPETSRHDILSQQSRFIEAAGGKIAAKDGGESLEIEVSPLVSYAGEGLECVKGKSILSPAVIETLEDLNKIMS